MSSRTSEAKIHASSPTEGPNMISKSRRKYPTLQAIKVPHSDFVVKNMDDLKLRALSGIFSSSFKRHADAVDLYFSNPDLIEKGFKPLFKEFGAGNWRRIDILGTDQNGNLVVVEIKTGKVEGVEKQVKKYRSGLNALFHALKLQVPIRIIIITPESQIDLGCSSVDIPRLAKPLKGLPLSREIYGLKRGET